MEPWLINASLKDNILFGQTYEEERYNEVLRICDLNRDLLLLNNGDSTFVFELNLSIAQKHRVSLARCLYRNPDVILLEDPLSDFDQSTAKKFFFDCIKKDLVPTKAILMVTQLKQVRPSSKIRVL